MSDRTLPHNLEAERCVLGAELPVRAARGGDGAVEGGEAFGDGRVAGLGDDQFRDAAT